MTQPFPDLKEEIYDSSVLEDEQCSLLDDGYWYENDLLLAAELGKTLLERNRDLESQFLHSQKTIQDQQLEIDLLTKQLMTLRDLNQSKMKIYEEVDRHCHELEGTNRTFQSEINANQLKIASMTRTISSLETHSEDMRDKVRRLEEEREEWLRWRQKREVQGSTGSGFGRFWRSNSLPSVAPGYCPSSLAHLDGQVGSRRDDSPERDSPKQLAELRIRLTEANTSLRLERRRRADLESDMDSVLLRLEEADARWKEAQGRLDRLEREQQDYDVAANTERENLGSADKGQQSSQARSGEDPVHRDLFSAVEHDIVLADQETSEVGRLKSGGKVFTSRESLNRVGASLPHTDIPDSSAPPGSNISLLAELDDKYNKLVEEYESLLTSKKSAPVAPSVASTTASTATSPTGSLVFEFENRLDHIFSEETRRQRKTMITQDYKPKYKELFRDAFGLLKEMKQGQSVPSTKPTGRHRYRKGHK